MCATVIVSGVRMGKPGVGHATSLLREREPGELKHLSSQRKRKNSVSSGERTRKSLNPARGVVGLGRRE